MLLTTEHFGITVSSLDRSVSFYRALLGSEPFYMATEGRPYLGAMVGYPGCRIRMAFFHLPGTSAFLELLEYEMPEGSAKSLETHDTGVSHLCFVVDDLATEFERISSIGATFRHDGPVDRADGGRAIYGRDPDGISIELQEHPR